MSCNLLHSASIVYAVSLLVSITGSAQVVHLQECSQEEVMSMFQRHCFRYGRGVAWAVVLRGVE